MNQYGDVSMRAAMGLFRRGAKVAAICREAGRGGVSTLEHDDDVQELWHFARAYADPTATPEIGPLYDAARELACHSASMLEAGVNLAPRSGEALVRSWDELASRLRGRVRLLIDLLVEDEALLRSYAASRLSAYEEVDLDLLAAVEDCALAAALTASENPPPEEYGLRIAVAGAKRLPDEPARRGPLPVVQLLAEFTVFDPARLVDFAVAEFSRCWFDGYWEPKDVPEALAEAVFSSNRNPSPVDWGVACQEISAAMVPEPYEGYEGYEDDKAEKDKKDKKAERAKRAKSSKGAA